MVRQRTGIEKEPCSPICIPRVSDGDDRSSDIQFHGPYQRNLCVKILDDARTERHCRHDKPVTKPLQTKFIGSPLRDTVWPDPILPGGRIDTSKKSATESEARSDYIHSRGSQQNQLPSMDSKRNAVNARDTLVTRAIIEYSRPTAHRFEPANERQLGEHQPSKSKNSIRSGADRKSCTNVACQGKNASRRRNQIGIRTALPVNARERPREPVFDGSDVCACCWGNGWLE